MCFFSHLTNQLQHFEDYCWHLQEKNKRKMEEHCLLLNKMNLTYEGWGCGRDKVKASVSLFTGLRNWRC